MATSVTPIFPPASRYYSVSTGSLTTGDGRVVRYLLRRFVPQPDTLQTIATYTVLDGDRIDNIAQKTLDDPGQFWRLCDANTAMESSELTDTAGRVLLVGLPNAGGTTGSFR